MTTPLPTLVPARFGDLPGWDGDDHLAAWKAFVASCKPVLDAAKGGSKAGPRPTPQSLLDICQLALLTAKAGPNQTRAGAKVFFETHFKPHRVAKTSSEGLLTGS